MLKKALDLLTKAPSWVWVFLFPLGIIAFVASIITLFYLLANVEGFASIIFIVVGFGLGSALATKMPGIVAGGAICFYALMGMAVDQPGNYFFNKPIEWFGCPPQTTLNRTVDVTHPLPGRTDMTQNFQCFDSQGKLAGRASMTKVIGIRFLEYVAIAYLFMGLKVAHRKITTSSKL